MKLSAASLVPLMLLPLLTASLAQAEATPADKASAEALFNEGIALVRSGRVADGCAKFEGSQALDPTLGTELRLADCYERLEKTASAWALFKECQGLAHRRGELDREALARERAEALAARLSFLTIESSEPDLAGISIQRNDRPVPIASLGAKIPVDPGLQRIDVSAPDRVSWSTSVFVPAPSGSVHIKIPRLALAESPEPSTPPATTGAAERAAAAESAPAASLAPAPDRPTAPTARTGNAQRSVGVVATVVGAAGLLSGVGLGWYAKHENDASQSNRLCPQDHHNGCTAEGLELRSRAKSYAAASTITLAASGAVLATGIVLWSTAPSGGDRAVPQSTSSLTLSTHVSLGAFQTALKGSF